MQVDLTGGGTSIFGGNLPLEITKDELRQESMASGQVISVDVMSECGSPDMGLTVVS